MHGYKDEYQDKIPFNDAGIAPVLIPALGFRYGKFLAEANLLGASGLTVTMGFAF